MTLIRPSRRPLSSGVDVPGAGPLRDALRGPAASPCDGEAAEVAGRRRIRRASSAALTAHNPSSALARPPRNELQDAAADAGRWRRLGTSGVVAAGIVPALAPPAPSASALARRPTQRSDSSRLSGEGKPVRMPAERRLPPPRPSLSGPHGANAWWWRYARPPRGAFPPRRLPPREHQDRRQELMDGAPRPRPARPREKTRTSLPRPVATRAGSSPTGPAVAPLDSRRSHRSRTPPARGLGRPASGIICPKSGTSGSTYPTSLMRWPPRGTSAPRGPESPTAPAARRPPPSRALMETAANVSQCRRLASPRPKRRHGQRRNRSRCRRSPARSRQHQLANEGCLWRPRSSPICGSSETCAAPHDPQAPIHLG